MGTGRLHVDLDAVAANWRALDAMSGGGVETGATIKADAYGLGVAPVAKRLVREGARTFFVAQAEEGVALRAVLGVGPRIMVFSGHMEGDADLLRQADLVPMLNAIEQMTRHFETLPGHAFGVQLDSGMNRLGLEPAEWAAARPVIEPQRPALVMSHLACADTPSDAMNDAQLAAFRDMTAGLTAPLSLAATGGILLGQDFHFDLTRPGIGLYGGAPFGDARPVVRLDLPVIQIRDVAEGESVGYGSAWIAGRPSRIATLSAGYADGLIRAMGGNLALWSDGMACPLVGRVSMDLLTVDVTDLDHAPDHLSILTPEQGVDALASAAGTIGYEILTSLGPRYARHHGGATD